MKLKTFQQKYSHSCIPACVRIVLEYWGYCYTEEELISACKCFPRVGTLPENAISGIESLGHNALWFEEATTERLISLIENKWPVIVFLYAGDLPYGRSGLHAVVVNKINKGKILYIDPALAKEVVLDLDVFLKAWGDLDNQGIVIWTHDKSV
jgi:ABC-type bacteriocin/lantibiotic exporter with double-glycine peptidase domain